MTLDRSFAARLRDVANGDHAQKYAMRLAKELRDVAAALEYRYMFNGCVKRYGREKVALCLAATMTTEYGYEAGQREWAIEVMALWRNRAPRSVQTAVINLHPAILADISSRFRQYCSLKPDEDYPAKCEGCNYLRESRNQVDIYLPSEFAGYCCNLKPGEKCPQ